MKKFLLTLLLGFALLTPGLVLAKLDLGGSLVNNAAVQAGYDEKTNEQSFAELIGTVIKSVLSFVGVIFLVLMVYAGFLWMTAKGEDTQIEKAQDIIRSSVIGLAITVGAFSITTFVVPKIVEKTTGDTQADGGGDGAGGGADNMVLCCTKRLGDPSNNVDVAKSIVANDDECKNDAAICKTDNRDNGKCTVERVLRDQCR